MPYIRKIEGTKQLWELRVKHSSSFFRVFYFLYIKERFVLVHAIKKKSAKISVRDTNISLSRVKKYLEGMIVNEAQ